MIREEDLIRGEETLPLLKVLVVNVVECSRSRRVHVDGDLRVHILGAHLLQLGCVIPVECWVHWGAVYSIREPVAVGESEGVCTCKRIAISMLIEKENSQEYKSYSNVWFLFFQNESSFSCFCMCSVHVPNELEVRL